MLSDHQSPQDEARAGWWFRWDRLLPRRKSWDRDDSIAGAKDKTLNSLFTTGHWKNGIIAVIRVKQCFNDCFIFKKYVCKSLRVERCQFALAEQWDLLSPSKSWQKSGTSGQAVLCSVNESQHQAWTDHTRVWRRDPQQREEYLLSSFVVISVDGCGSFCTRVCIHL